MVDTNMYTDTEAALVKLIDRLRADNAALREQLTEARQGIEEREKSLAVAAAMICRIGDAIKGLREQLAVHERRWRVLEDGADGGLQIISSPNDPKWSVGTRIFQMVGSDLFEGDTLAEALDAAAELGVKG